MNPQPANLESAALPIELHPFDQDHRGLFLSRLFMQRVSTKPRAVLHQLETLSSSSLFDYAVIPLPGLRALKPNILSHDKTSGRKMRNCLLEPPAGSKTRQNQTYFRILVTTPDPTVLPPSRIAKRLCSSNAIGLSNSTSTLTLSPGIHISAPPSSVVEPVTSVVLK